MATDPGKWVDQYGDILYRFAVIRVRDPEIAEDLVQETFLSALKAQERFLGRSSEKTWLIGILKHKIIDHFRNRAVEPPVGDPLAFSTEIDENFFDRKGRWKIPPGKWNGSPEEILKNKDFWQVLHRCLDGLSPNLRQVFTLRELDEMNSEELCKALGISPTNLWVILHRARNALRRCMEKNWFGGNDR